MEFVRKKALLLAVICLFLINIFIWQEIVTGGSRAEANNILKIYFLDVGQGDATFIEAPNGNQVLIDGGRTDNKVLQELGTVMPLGDRSIDVVIATHPDADHIGGLPEVFSRFEIENYIESGNKTKETKIVETLENSLAGEEGLVRVIAKKGMIVSLDEEAGAHLEILFPDRDVSGVESNAASIISRLIYKESCFLFMGDSPKQVEEYLLKIYGNLECDVLKAGHHGSRTSSGEIFVKNISPQYAVIFSGKANTYGHPHREAIDILNKYSVEIFRTDEKGRMEFISDGENISVN